MDIPIIYFHKSHSYYLHAALLKARMTNPNRDIILLGDETNARYSFVRHYNIKDYMNYANEFAKVYEHHSPNPFAFELMCFQRWFVIKEFVCKNIGGAFLYCDTDTLLFTDITEDLKTWVDYSFTICRTGTPCFTYFNKGEIEKFTDFIYRLYSSMEGRDLIRTYAKRLRDEKKRYGISDMTAFMAYERCQGVKCLHVDSIVNGTCYGHNYRDRNDGYEMRDNHYNVKEGPGIPSCLFLPTNEIVKFKGLHCQGGMKKRMPNFFPWHIKIMLRYEDYMERLSRKIKTLLCL